MKFSRRESGLLAPEDGLIVPRPNLRGLQAWDPAGLGTLVGAKPPSFSPSDIAGLQLWLKADAITGLNDGDALTTWEDSHTSNNDFAQATAGKKPTYQTNEINGLPVVRFDGTDDLLTAANFLSSSEGTVFAVVRFTAAIAHGTRILASADQATNSYWWLCTASYSSGVPNIAIEQKNNDTSTGVGGSTALAAATPYIEMWHSNGTAYSLRVNGNDETESLIAGTDNGDWLGDTANRDAFSLGAQKLVAEGAFFKGDIGELIMYDTGISAGNITSVETYLNARWAAF